MPPLLFQISKRKANGMLMWMPQTIPVTKNAIKLAPSGLTSYNCHIFL